MENSVGRFCTQLSERGDKVYFTGTPEFIGDLGAGPYHILGDKLGFMPYLNCSHHISLSPSIFFTFQRPCSLLLLRRLRNTDSEERTRRHCCQINIDVTFFRTLT